MSWGEIQEGVARAARIAAVVGLIAGPAVAAQGLRYGPASALGRGTVRTYLALDAQGQPTELGVALSGAAMHSLPDFADKPAEESFVIVDLPCPAQNPTPYRFVSMDWNPKGHEPMMYEVPHFDFHFYLVDPAERDAIVPTDSASFAARGMQQPGDGYLPANYVNPGGTTVPRMGSHWIDPASHEFHGEPFDKTFIYGTWDGRVIFHEPMITKAYLDQRTDETFEIATASRHEKPGAYPNAYRVSYDADADEYRVALSGLAPGTQ